MADVPDTAADTPSGVVGTDPGTVPTAEASAGVDSPKPIWLAAFPLTAVTEK